MIPLKDNVPTSGFAWVTAVLIAINIGFFVWQQTFSGSEAASPRLTNPTLTERDQNSVQYGAIPYRVLNPGEDCAFDEIAGADETGIVCQGTPEYRGAQQSGELVPYDNPPWWLTLFTSMFMHGGILHIAFNMLFLWIFGNNVEDSMGRARYLLFYLLAGLAAVYAQSAIDPGGTLPMIGASGAVAGVLGAYALLLPRARVLTAVILIFFITLIEIPAFVMLGIWFVLQFLPAIGQVAVPEVSGEGGVAYFAHVGGFVFGLALVKLFAHRRPDTPERIAAGW